MHGIHELAEIGAPEQLARIDLNLLVAFDALARERSVTRAAARVGLTQSAMSHALRRLRELLDDPLLVRGRGGLALTPRAESLVVPLRGGLVSLGRALAAPERFEPRSSRRFFRIAAPDLFDVVVLPALLARIVADAPGVDLGIVPGTRLAEQLETGEIDVAVVPEVEEGRARPVELSAAGLLRLVLLRDGFSCYIRAGHPALCKPRGRGAKRGPPPLSLEAFAGLSHLVVSPGGDGPSFVDRALDSHGLTRRIALRIPQFYSALTLVAQSDLVLTAPSALSRVIVGTHPVLALPPPVPLPKHGINLVWHERFGREPGHAWLRGVLAAVARGTRSPPGSS